MVIVMVIKDTFNVSEKQIDIICSTSNTPQSNHDFDHISANINRVLEDLRDSPKHDFIALKGWRNECYNIRPTFSAPPLFKMERSATCKMYFDLLFIGRNVFRI